MQIGDLTEIMYFVAHSQEEMDEWLRAFRHGEDQITTIKASILVLLSLPTSPSVFFFL